MQREVRDWADSEVFAEWHGDISEVTLHQDQILPGEKLASVGDIYLMVYALLDLSCAGLSMLYLHGSSYQYQIGNVGRNTVP